MKDLIYGAVVGRVGEDENGVSRLVLSLCGGGELYIRVYPQWIKRAKRNLYDRKVKVIVQVSGPTQGKRKGRAP